MQTGLCPHCACPESHVVWTRKRAVKRRTLTGEDEIKIRIHRRRECDLCQSRYTTREEILPGSLKPGDPG